MSSRALAWALVLLLPIQSCDDAARDAVQRLRRPVLEAPMHVLSDDARPGLIVAAALVLVSGTAGRALLGETALALVPVNLAVEGLKYLVNRPRPDGERRRSNAAFPSSHAANAFAIATVLSRRWRRGAPAFFALAALIGFSRLYLNRHWLSDVAGGALLGVALALAANAAWRRWRHTRSATRAA